MKTSTTQQEVLFIINSSFASRQYSEKDSTGEDKNLLGNEKIKDACWNGLIKEMIPEIFQPEDKAVKLFLWQVREANQFLALEMSEYPTGVNKYLSIDPYRFMEVKTLN